MSAPELETAEWLPFVCSHCGGAGVEIAGAHTYSDTRRPAPTAEAGGAGAGHSLPSAGSDVAVEQHGQTAALLAEFVMEADATVVAASAPVSVPAVVSPADVPDVPGDSDAAALDDLASFPRQLHVTSPVALGSAHHKRDTDDGEATDDGSQGRSRDPRGVS